jgi:tRNA threonylcarbamoyladenosine modification (KEOPS) complex  Pcc1 subunit
MNALRTARILTIILAAASTVFLASCGGGGSKSRTAPMSTNTELRSLTISNCGDVFLDFDPGTYSYGPFSQGNATASYTITAEKGEDAQIVTIGQTAQLEVQGKLSVGLNVIAVEVTAADGVTKQTYSVSIIRADIGVIPPTHSCDLTGGTIKTADGTDVILDSAINADTHQYGGTVSNKESSVSIADLVIAEGATMTAVLNGKDYSGEFSSLALSEGDNTIVITIHGEDGYSQSYTFNIRRKTSTPEIAGLTLLWEGVVQNQINFKSSTLTYDLTAAALDAAITECSVQVTKANRYQSVKINSEELVTKKISLVPGDNTISILVTAEDGSPSQTYTLKLYRTAPKSTNAMLSDLALSNCGTASFLFSPETTAYGPFTMGFGVASYTLTAVKAESAQKVTINTAAELTNSGILNVGTNVIYVVVTAEDGVTQKTYSVTIIRYAQGTPPPTDTSDLTGGTITVPGGSTISFDNPISPDTYTYTTTVPNGTDTVSLTGLTTQPGATTTITVNGVTVGDISAIPLQEGDNVIVVVVHGTDGYDQTYVFNIRRQTSTALLANLSITWGDLTENRITFDSATEAYDLSASPADNSINTCSIETSGVNEYQTITLSVNGSTVTGSSAPLAVGSNSVRIDVLAEDLVSTKSYTITVCRNGNSAPANIQLVCSGVNMIYDAATKDYSFGVVSSVDTASIQAWKSDPTQSIVISANSTALADLSGSFDIAYGVNTVTIKVSGTGVEDSTYTIKITREDTADSIDATLRAIDMTNVVLIPRFDKYTRIYSAEVDNSVISTSILPHATSSASRVKVNGTEISAAQSIDLSVGKNTITIDVIAQNAAYTLTYKVDVYRADTTHSNNSALAGISVSPVEALLGTLFNPNILSYSANVEYKIQSVSISAQRAENVQTVKVNGTAVDYNSTSVSVPIDLAVGKTTVTIDVTAEDGISARTYTLEFNRAQEGISNNANLSALVLSSPAASITPLFNKNCLDYKAFVDADITSINVTPTVAGTGATVSVNLHEAVSGSATAVALGDKGSDTVIKITVTAQDGTPRTYTLVINRATDLWSNNASLSGITLSTGTLLPSFSSSQLEYVANVDSSVTSITASATQTISGANSKLTFNGNTSGTVSLGYGRNIIEITSIAQDGSSSMTYTVQVYRREAGLTLYFKMPSGWKGDSNRAAIVYNALTSAGAALSGTAVMDQLDDARDWWSYTIIDAASTTSVQFQNAKSNPTSSKLTAARLTNQYWHDGTNWLSALPSSFPTLCVSAMPRANVATYAVPFNTTKVITLTVGGSGVEYSKYTTDGTDPKTSTSAAYYVNNMQIIIGQNMIAGETMTLKLYGVTASGTEASVSYKYEKTGKGMTVHFKLPKTWSTAAPVLHQWVGSASVVTWAITGWKLAPEMNSDGSRWYSFTIDGLESCGVLFMESNSVADDSANITIDQTASASNCWFILNGGTGTGGGHSNRATGVWYGSQSAADTAAAAYTSLY